VGGQGAKIWPSCFPSVEMQKLVKMAERGVPEGQTQRRWCHLLGYDVVDCDKFVAACADVLHECVRQEQRRAGRDGGCRVQACAPLTVVPMFCNHYECANFSLWMF